MIKTARISETVDGIRLDITIKNAKNHVLSPTWDIVMGLKDGKITWAQYEEKYLALLKKRLKTRSSEFMAVLNMAVDENVYLICFCTDERYCHRRLAKEFLMKLKLEVLEKLLGQGYEQ